jgi:tRNA A37 N6-isopentenylltransferase MiaA
VAELPRPQALEALVLRTRRYAAYQRKWMRRIPDLILLDAARSPDVVADDVVRRVAA